MIANVGDPVFMNPAKSYIFLRHKAGVPSSNDFKFERKGDKLGIVTRVMNITFNTQSGQQTVTGYELKRDFYTPLLYVITGEAITGKEVDQKYLVDNIVRNDQATVNLLTELNTINNKLLAKGKAMPTALIATAKQVADSLNVRQTDIMNRKLIAEKQISGIGFAALIPVIAAWGIRAVPWIIRGVTWGAAILSVKTIYDIWQSWGVNYDQSAKDKFLATDVVAKARSLLSASEQQAFDQATDTLNKDATNAGYQQGQDDQTFAGGFGKGLGGVAGWGLLFLGGYLLVTRKGK